MVRYKHQTLSIEQMYHGSFNSSMVRYKHNISHTNPIDGSVSIPQWCDINGWILLRHFLILQVSIPQWCDINFNREFRTINASYVSIPQWCDINDLVANTPNQTDFVSIPQWCDINPECTITGMFIYLFQFLNGAI